MRFNIVFIFLILAFFQTEIQARWSRILPKSKKNQPSEIQSTQKSTSNFFPFLPKQFQDKSIEKIYKGYCQFLLGASKECMEQFLKFKKGKFQDKPTTSPTASATFSTTSTKTEKMHVNTWSPERTVKVCKMRSTFFQCSILETQIMYNQGRINISLTVYRPAPVEELQVPANRRPPPPSASNRRPPPPVNPPKPSFGRFVPVADEPSNRKPLKFPSSGEFDSVFWP